MKGVMADILISVFNTTDFMWSIFEAYLCLILGKEFIVSNFGGGGLAGVGIRVNHSDLFYGL